jgi:hypothetical protein
LLARLDDVHEFHNFLMYDIDDEPWEDVVTFTVQQVKSYLCAYLGCLDPAWR